MTESKYRVIYIDEEPAWRRAFARYANSYFEVETFPPGAELDAFVDELLSLKPQAIVTDHSLNEADSSISYDGTDIIKRVHLRRDKFPCFVLTNYNAKASNEAEDVNYVYSKSVLNDEETDEDGDSKKALPFYDKIRLQVHNYEKMAHQAQDRLYSLVKKSSTQPLTAKEEEELITLDNLVNQTVAKNLDVPTNLKSSEHTKALQDLINISAQLIQKIDAK